MRRIKVYSDGLVKLWEKFFINDTAKFIKSTHLERDDLGKTFTEKNGNEWKILGAMEGNEIVCKNVATHEVWAISRWKVSSILYPEPHAEWKKEEKEKAKAAKEAAKVEKKVKKVKAPVAVAAAVIPEAEAELEPEIAELPEDLFEEPLPGEEIAEEPFGDVAEEADGTNG